MRANRTKMRRSAGCKFDPTTSAVQKERRGKRARAAGTSRVHAYNRARIKRAGAPQCLILSIGYLLVTRRTPAHEDTPRSASLTLEAHAHVCTCGGSLDCTKMSAGGLILPSLEDGALYFARGRYVPISTHVYMCAPMTYFPARAAKQALLVSWRGPAYDDNWWFRSGCVPRSICSGSHAGMGELDRTGAAAVFARI